MTPAPVRQPKGNLVDELNEFVGRRDELAAGKRALVQSRLVTLTGTGGIGKTRLAIRLGSAVQRAFADGVWLVELGNLRDPALLAREVARSLGLSDRSNPWAVATLAGHLADRNALLILDNCEHLLDACAVLVDSVLRNCAGVRLLVTSREPLAVTGELVVPVLTMSVPDSGRPATPDSLLRSEAARLFLCRAAEVSPALTASPENAQTIADLVHRLEGMPLAIELAAVRLRSLSPRQILTRLDDRFRLLTGGRRTADARQQTLAATMAWSYDLLSREEQAMWRRTTVFSGSFDLESAEAVCALDDGGPDAVFALVDGLVAKSVLLREAGPEVARYRMLDTVREFGEALLDDSSEGGCLRRRHRDWFAALAERFEPLGADQVEWFDRLHADHANLRTALEFCVTESGEAAAGLRMVCDLWPYWETRGHLTEGRRWVRTMLSAVGDECNLRARGLWVAGYLDMMQEDLVPAASHLEDALALGRAQDEPTVAYAAQYLGRTVWMLGETERGRRYTEQALEQHRATGNWQGVVLALVQLGVIRILSDDWLGTDELLEESVRSCTSRGERWNRSYGLWALGLGAWLRGALTDAAAFEMAALRLKRAIRDSVGAPLCIEALAWIAADEGRFQRAAVLLGAAAAAWQVVPWAMPGPFHVHDRACRAAARHSLGDPAFDTAFAEGQGLGTAEAVRISLDEPVPPAPVTDDPEWLAAGQLTRRELQVVALIADGMSNAEIGRTLMVSTRTVESHVRHIMDKLGFSSRAQIAGWSVSRTTTRTKP